MSRWFVTRHWRDSITVAADAAQVAAWFERPIEFMKVNPTVVAMEPIPNTEGGYYATEQIPILGMTFNHRFRAEVHQKTAAIATQAWSFPKIHIQTSFTYQPDGAQTHVLIDTKLTVLSFLANFVAGAAQKARLDMLANLKQKLESPILS